MTLSLYFNMKANDKIRKVIIKYDKIYNFGK